MSLIGSVALSNNDGVFLGKVAIDNLNIQPNQLLYSNNGINIDGLSLGNGLQKNNSNLQKYIYV